MLIIDIIKYTYVWLRRKLIFFKYLLGMYVCTKDSPTNDLEVLLNTFDLQFNNSL